MSTIAVIMSNRAEHVDFGLPRMILYILLSAIGMWLSTLGGDGFSILAILAKIVVLIAAAAMFLLPYGKDLITLLRGIVKKRK